mgnify:CR=1 FL=1
MTLPPGSQAAIDAFIDALWLEEGLSANTLSAYRRDLTLFNDWLSARGQSVLLASESHIQAYFAARHADTRRDDFFKRGDIRLISRDRCRVITA